MKKAALKKIFEMQCGICKALAHPLRLRIVAELCNGEMYVNELCEALGAKQAAVSQHLAPLRMLGLLNVERSGGKAIYSLGKSRLPQMVDCIKCCGTKN